MAYICPGGYDCDTDPDNISACPTGYYSPEGTLACTQAVKPLVASEPALGADQQINCAKVRGYYSDNNGDTACTICPAGHECPYDSTGTRTTPTACNAGEFSLPGSEFCNTCPKGYACADTTLPKMTYCLTGSYSDGGQDACTTCE